MRGVRKAREDRRRKTRENTTGSGERKPKSRQGETGCSQTMLSEKLQCMHYSAPDLTFSVSSSRAAVCSASQRSAPTSNSTFSGK